ncbi:DUF2062 domain-containing protein [Geminicoccaceae bacterium 1502E]|nr:DUF2062 domain-containing protein [Geminicoccaceae bacterium 1502E]
MILRRRRQPSWPEKLREWIWPRAGWTRVGRYFYARIQRLQGTPHSIAAGLACGAAASCTPFIGFHFLLSFALAFLVRGSYLAAAFGTVLGNPWTFPFIWAGTFKLGSLMLGGGAGAEASPHDLLAAGAFFSRLETLLIPMTVGSLPVALVVALILYLPLVRLFGVLQEARRRRLATRRSAAGTV